MSGLSGIEYLPCVVEVNLSHEAALCPATDILADFPEHERLRSATAFHPRHTRGHGACELGSRSGSDPDIPRCCRAAVI